MKVENMSNQIVTKNFFGAVLDIIAENTSTNYSIVAVNGIKGQLSEQFKFLRNVYIKDSTIEVSDNINSVGKNELKRFFIEAINMMGPNYLKVLLSRRLDQKDLAYLEDIGIRFG